VRYLYLRDQNFISKNESQNLDNGNWHNTNIQTCYSFMNHKYFSKLCKLDISHCKENTISILKNINENISILKVTLLKHSESGDENNNQLEVFKRFKKLNHLHINYVISRAFSRSNNYDHEKDRYENCLIIDENFQHLKKLQFLTINSCQYVLFKKKAFHKNVKIKLFNVKNLSFNIPKEKDKPHMRKINNVKNLEIMSQNELFNQISCVEFLKFYKINGYNDSTFIDFNYLSNKLKVLILNDVKLMKNQIPNIIQNLKSLQELLLCDVEEDGQYNDKVLRKNNSNLPNTSIKT
jgi:hypothetical protein